MKTTPAPLWPQDYQQWTGSFKELVAAAQAVVAQLEPQAKAPTERLLRYYQQQGVLGRGTRGHGNQAVFGFEDLAAIVTAKSLVQQNWTLDNAAKLFATPGQKASDVSSMLYSPSGNARVAEAQPAFGAASAVPTSAQSVVAQLMAQSHHTPHPGRGTPLALQGALNGPTRSAVAPAAAYASAPVQSIRPVPWLTVYLDEAAAQGAAPTERAQARAALEALLKTLR